MDASPDASLDLYDIYRDQNTSLLKAVLKHSKDHHFLICQQRFPKTAETTRRLDDLRTAFRGGFLLVSALIIEGEEVSTLTSYTVEPVQSNFEKLSQVLLEGRLTKVQKINLFRNLLGLVMSLHDLSIPYLELSPDSIFIENKSVVFLRAFHILPIESRCTSWYQSPEQLFSHRFLGIAKECDIWALGCVYADMFLSLTPLFQSVEDEDKLHTLFDILGLPDYSEISTYVSEEVYGNLRSITHDPALPSLLSNLSAEEGDYLVSMLEFNPSARPPIQRLVSSLPEIDRNQSLLEEENPPGRRTAPAYLSSALASGPYEFNEQTDSGSLFSSPLSSSNMPFAGIHIYEEKGRNFPKRIDRKNVDFPRLQEDLIEELPNLDSDIDFPKQINPPDVRKNHTSNRAVGVGPQEVRFRPLEEIKITDNLVTVNVILMKNLLCDIDSVYKYRETQDCTVTVEVEVDTGGKVEKERTLPVLASDLLKLNFKSKYRVNSSDFKSKYRHNPLKVYVYQKPLSPKPGKAQDTVLGVCKVYLGLLFLAAKPGVEPSVSGWFHITAENSGAILGQALLEVTSDHTFTSTPPEPKRRVDFFAPELDAEDTKTRGSTVRKICESEAYTDLDTLTEQLRQKEKLTSGNEAGLSGNGMVNTLKTRLFSRS